MKTLHRYKKVFQNTCLSLICALFFVVSSTPPAKADIIKQGTVATTYGSYHWECFAGTADSPISLALNVIGINLSFRSGSGFSFRYNFKDKYSGQITIGITTSNAWRYIDSYCTVNGGAFNSTPASASSYLTSHTFTINFEQCEYLEFAVYLDGVAYANYFNSNTTISIAYGRTPTVDDKLTEIDTAIDLYMPGMSSSLTNIASNTATMASDIAILKGYLDGLEGYTDQLESILSNLYSEVADIHNIIPFGIDLSSVPAYIQFLNTGQSITYNNTVLPYSYFTFTGGTSYTLRFNLNQNESRYISFITGLSTPSWTLPQNVTMETVKYTGISPLYALVTLKFTNTGSYGWYDFVFTYTYTRNLVPIYFGDGVGLDADLAGFIGLDINNTYTTLLQQIADGIGNISQQQIIENNTNINNYNDYQTQIHNVENNYYNQYNTYETNIENNNTFDFTGLDSDGVTAFNDIFTSMYNLPLVKWPVLITLLGLVIVIILG